MKDSRKVLLRLVIYNIEKIYKEKDMMYNISYDII